MEPPKLYFDTTSKHRKQSPWGVVCIGTATLRLQLAAPFSKTFLCLTARGNFRDIEENSNPSLRSTQSIKWLKDGRPLIHTACALLKPVMMLASVGPKLVQFQKNKNLYIYIYIYIHIRKGRLRFRESRNRKTNLKPKM